MDRKSCVAVAVASSLLFASSAGAADMKQGAIGAVDAQTVIKSWKEQPRAVAQTMMKKYGAPQEVTAQRLVWHNNGPWKRTVLINEEIDHDFPMPHKDMLRQVVNYSVPPEKFDELAMYDGSVIVDRTRGEISARCDKEPANFIALNLAHGVVTGKLGVEEARKMYADQIIAFATGKPAPMATKLVFSPPAQAGYSDRAIMEKATIEQVKQAMKQKSM